MLSKFCRFSSLSDSQRFVIKVMNSKTGFIEKLRSFLKTGIQLCEIDAWDALK